MPAIPLKRRQVGVIEGVRAVHHRFARIRLQPRPQVSFRMNYALGFGVGQLRLVLHRPLRTHVSQFQAGDIKAERQFVGLVGLENQLRTFTIDAFHHDIGQHPIPGLARVGGSRVRLRFGGCSCGRLRSLLTPARCARRRGLLFCQRRFEARGFVSFRPRRHIDPQPHQPHPRNLDWLAPLIAQGYVKPEFVQRDQRDRLHRYLQRSIASRVLRGPDAQPLPGRPDAPLAIEPIAERYMEIVQLHPRLEFLLQSLHQARPQ